MSDPSASTTGSSDGTGSGSASETKADRSELFARLLWMIAFGFLGYVAFWASIFLGLVQLIVVAVTGAKNEELRGFTRNLAQYVWECVAFFVFARDDKPFPIGRFPNVNPGVDDA
ncbi:hypothetical protein FHS78_000452 [Parvibaculum indicum]|uniref:DUF4389 domain-containing protein n=1 Tax=Parvibaculum indicum TaxID=562969 RepID=UPI00141D88BF|nr:DUF4389 domain-containing protein [Parvibaculum indicum]NIJ40197.1 hypothetical protein [Parvibaculum indicum]